MLPYIETIRCQALLNVESCYSRRKYLVVEDGLVARCDQGWHETQLDERLHSDGHQEVVDGVDVEERIRSSGGRVSIVEFQQSADEDEIHEHERLP